MFSLTVNHNPLNVSAVKEILQLGKQRACKLYIVGGYIRDALIDASSKASSAHKNSKHKDFDFMVMHESAVEFARVVADKLGAHFVLLDEQNDTARVVTDDGDYYDFAGCVGGSLETDIKRRDLTVNAIAWDGDKPDELIDLVGGICDIENRRIKAISEQSFIDDPLRLLRAYRFASLLNFDIDEQTQSYIKEHSALLANVAAERVSYELFLMLDSDNAGKQIKAMGDNGILECIFSELKDTRRVTSNAFHHLGLFDHSVETLVQAERTLPEMPDWAKDSLSEQLSPGVSRRAATKLAGLVHDIGKPNTWVITEEGKHTFIGHDKLGAELCDPLAKRLKWSKPVERFIEKLVRWHLRPGHLFQQGQPTDKARYRFYKTIGAELPELIVLALADFRSTCGPGLQDGRRAAEQNLFELLANFSVYQLKKKKETRFLDGNQVMELLGISPGPAVGELLEDILEAQSLGEVQNHDEAVSLAKKLYQEKYSK